MVADVRRLSAGRCAHATRAPRDACARATRHACGARYHRPVQPALDLDDVAPAPFRLSALDAIESDIVAVAAAIEALDNGTYGRCGFCGVDIPASDLSTDPLATRCAEHR
jgi:hypothetical protein